MYSTAGARAAIKAQAGAVNSTTGARVAITCRNWCDVLHRWLTCCDHLQALVRCTPPLAHVLRSGTGWCDEPHHWRTCCDHLHKMVRCTPPLAHVLRSKHRLMQ